MSTQSEEPAAVDAPADNERITAVAAENGWTTERDGRLTRGAVSIRPDYYATGRLHSAHRAISTGSGYVPSAVYGKQAIDIALEWLTTTTDKG